MSEIVNKNETPKNETPVPMPLSEKLKELTGYLGIRLGEQPEYHVLRSEEDCQIRKYHPMTMASVVIPVHGDAHGARQAAFKILSGYMFGQNDLGHHIALTAPVLHEWHHAAPLADDENKAGALTMSFVLPITYGLENAPGPLDSRIMVHRRPACKVACITYSGTNGPDRIREHEQRLRQWLKRLSAYRPLDETQVAEYDSAGTPAFLRRNELHIELRSAH